MTKKVLVALILVIVILAWPVLSAGEDFNFPLLQYTDWSFNEDFTEVTINEETYQNYVITAYYREGNRINIKNEAISYLTNPYQQFFYPPDIYFEEGIKENIKNSLEGMANNYPQWELISINYNPWQESEFKDFYLNLLAEKEFENIEEDKLSQLARNSNNNGYADLFFLDKNIAEIENSIEKTQAEKRLEEVKLATTRASLLKSSTELESDRIDTFMSHILSEHIELGNYGNFLENSWQVIDEVIGRIQVNMYIDNPVITITKNGLPRIEVLDVAPYIDSEYTLVPVRAMMEAFNTTVEWLPKTRQVEISGEEKEINILLTIDSEEAIINNEKVNMPIPARITNDRTMIPLRFISENLGYDVIWHEDERKITVFQYTG